ncbi:tobamovirus multiplication protein 2A [Cinnamomum micranthum f. kanehirae]|uniref:Tobamovirus multiplication protein 2A n=1 Tax=Cinnamomum micranthum f. kanehirae TaxID=337451 RepID=A0A3S3N316_9MAGN|nr:tobamovirus multiplication protein 2A [Cinnamomum micranthum f. kanehirae]
MACRGCLECLLKILNFLLTVAGLGMVGYGIYLLVEWKRVSDVEPFPPEISPASGDHELVMVGRPMLLILSLSTDILDKLPKAWHTSFITGRNVHNTTADYAFANKRDIIMLRRFIYLFIAVGVVLFVVSCFGCIGAATRNGCCLSCYSLLVILLILVELGCAAFIFFDHSWKEVIPSDKTGDFDMIYDFLKKNWKIAKWVALGAVILEALAFLLALIIRAANRPADYDSDEEHMTSRSSSIRQPLINRQVPATGVPVAATLDQRPSRNDAWSTRMREKYGLDTAEFSYNPSESNRFQQAPPPTQTEERSRCSIM